MFLPNSMHISFHISFCYFIVIFITLSWYIYNLPICFTLVLFCYSLSLLCISSLSLSVCFFLSSVSLFCSFVSVLNSFFVCLSFFQFNILEDFKKKTYFQKSFLCFHSKNNTFKMQSCPSSHSL